MSNNEKRKASESPLASYKRARLGILTQEFPKTEERAEFIAAKFSKLLGNDTGFPGILDKACFDCKKTLLFETGDISEYWFNWFVDKKAWFRAMKFVPEKDSEPFPWQSVPSSEPKDPSDRATWLPRFKETQAMLADLTSRERLENGLGLMAEEPYMRRTTPSMTSIKIRQTIWNDVFPGKRCAENRPFEFALPRHLNYMTHVYSDSRKWPQHLPPGIRIVAVNAECPQGMPVHCLVFGYEKDTVDDRWNRFLLVAV